jgi:hypothetical protein
MTPLDFSRPVQTNDGHPDGSDALYSFDSKGVNALFSIENVPEPPVEAEHYAVLVQNDYSDVFIHLYSPKRGIPPKHGDTLGSGRIIGFKRIHIQSGEFDQ